MQKATSTEQRGSAGGAGRIRLALPGLARSGSRGHGGALLLVAALILAALFPLFSSSIFQLQVLTSTFWGAALAGGLVISLGYAGLLNLSQGTFYGIGAYTAASLVADHHVAFPLAIVAAMAAGAVGGMILGLASTRVAGDYFALVSLAYTIGIYELMQNWNGVTHGTAGFTGIPAISLFGVSLSGFTAGFYASLGVLVLTVAFLALFTTTFAARAMLAIRFDEAAAQSMGIDLLYTRQLSMALSGALAGLAGALLVAVVGIIEPNDFNLVQSFNICLWVIIGGMASVPGAVFAGAVITFVTQEFTGIADYSVGLLGIVVLVAVYFRGGVVRDLVHNRQARRAARRA